MPPKKVIRRSGYRFEFHSSHRRKSDAKRKAQARREFGLHARVVKSGGMYRVYNTRYTRAYLAHKAGRKTRRGGKKPKKIYYVTMTDKFMSGWGPAKGKTNKYVVRTNTYRQAQTIARNARLRDEMKYVNIVVGRKPSFDKRRFHVSWKEYKNLGKIWKKTGPRRR